MESRRHWGEVPMPWVLDDIHLRMLGAVTGQSVRVRDAMKKLHCDAVTFCPEALGVNVFVTCRKAGLKLNKTRRLRFDHHIALIGTSARGIREVHECR